MIVPFSHKLKETRFLNKAVPISIGVLLFSAISFHFFDIPIAAYFKTIPSKLRIVAQFITDLIDPWPGTAVWAVLYFFFNFFSKRKSLANRFLLISVSVSTANISIELLKWIFGRARPELLWSQNLYGFQFFASHDADFSFPSGHSCTIGAIMGALACFYPKYTYLFLAIAFIMAFSRVILSFHYLSDILVGMTIGLIVSQWVYRTMKIGTVNFKTNK
ncbi:MAG: phosphatase PAP2 family protein [Verrucomicrobia bacterium]|nr:phosphatase PAP2 family protein [Verrucomicrobiota bacterium]